MDKEMILKEAIRMSINGFLFEDGEILDIPDILREIADLYEKKIKKEEDK